MIKIKIGNVVRYSSRHGRVVDILESITTGERYAKVKFFRSPDNDLEIHRTRNLEISYIREMKLECSHNESQGDKK